MGNLVITGGSAKTFKAMITAATRTADLYYLRCPVPGGESRAWQRRSAPATDGQLRKDGGFRMRMHGPMRVLVVAADEAALGTAVAAIKTALEAQASGCSITYPDGQTADECFLIDGYPRQVGDRMADESGTWYVELEMMFEEN
ncbi:MAG: hypothetical protein ABIH03_05150 [Pseudomonadota bacterium]